MMILYGSQTGTAQDVAMRIWRIGKRRRIPELKIFTMNEFDATEFPRERAIVFICSTTGQGDEPDNMKIFWRFLCRRSLPADTLSHSHVAVLGLGDSSYQKFNFAAKKLFRRLLQLGARPLLPLGLADDQHDLGYDAVVDSWTKEFWTILERRSDEIFGFQLEAATDNDDIQPMYRAIWSSELANDGGTEIRSQLFISDKVTTDYSQNRPFYGVVIGNDRVTSIDHFQDTRLIRLSISNSKIDYLPGDVVYIQPKNLDETQREFLSLIDHFDPDRSFDLNPTDTCFKLPLEAILERPYTLRRCAESYFDLQAVPRRSFFELLARFAPIDSLEREKLLEFSSSQGQEDYFSYCTRPRRTVVETMRDFPQTVPRIPLEFWFDLIGCITPRAFSIASCLDTHPNEIQILMAVVNYKTRLFAPRLGLCSNWLSRLPLNSKVALWVGSGTLRFPWTRDPVVPCVMIGPGTGVAPFRSFLHWRASRKLGKNVLFFGCRNGSGDFYFRKEFEQMESDGVMNLRTAFSRDKLNENGKKIYVQHRILEFGASIADLIIGESAMIFIAGNAKQMPNEVIEALKAVVKNRLVREINFFTQDQDPDYLVDQIFMKFEKQKRLQIECWS